MKNGKSQFWRFIFAGIIVLSAASGCEDQDKPPVISHFNTEEILKLPSFPVNQDTVKFVLVSDIHEDYDLLSEVVEEINQMPEISFLVCCGDLTHFGKDDQFDSYVKAIAQASYPVFSVAGNHDYLSLSNLPFKEYFGQANFSFIWGPYQFILFDDSGGLVPVDTEWLKEQANQQESMNIVIAHKPPWDTDYESVFSQIASLDQTILFLHGHTHVYANTTFNGVPMLISTQLAQRKYYVVSLCGSNPEFKTVSF